MNLTQKDKNNDDNNQTYKVVLLQCINSLGDLAEDFIHGQLRVNLGKAR